MTNRFGLGFFVGFMVGFLLAAGTAHASPRMTRARALDDAAAVEDVIALNASNYASDIAVGDGRCISYTSARLGRVKRYDHRAAVVNVTVYDGRNDLSPVLARAHVIARRHKHGPDGVRWHWTVPPHDLQQVDDLDDPVNLCTSFDREFFVK